jgi:putative transposase
MNEAQRNVALFRYSLIREAADESLTIRQRGRLVRELAGSDHAGPNERRVRVARGTIDRWIRAYRADGFEALAPVSRTGEPVTELRLLDLAEALKREVPRRTAAQVAQIIGTAEGAGPSARTLQRHFARLGLNTRPDGSPPEAFGRFEAAAPGDLWTGDALHGPPIAGRKTYLFAFIDDHSRALVGYRWGLSEDTVRLEAAFRAALASRGVPRRCYVDNGSAYISKQLLRACASLGVRLVHSKPGRPEGRRKSKESSRRCAPSSLSRWRRGRLGTWPSSTGCSARGWRPSTTGAATPRPGRRPSTGCSPPARRRFRPPRRCTRRSCGPRRAR